MKQFLAFLQNLDADLRTGLQAQLRVLWTHHSTAIEGNSLTLGETDFVLGEGLTVAGKPLKDHQQVVGHARAIDFLTAYQTLAPFVALCRDAWQASLELVNEYRQHQAKRDRIRKP